MRSVIAGHIGPEIIHWRICGNGLPGEGAAAVGGFSFPDLIPLVWAQGNICRIASFKWVSRVAGNIDGVRILGVDADSAGIVVLASIKWPSRLGNETFLPIVSGPARVKIENPVF